MIQIGKTLYILNDHTYIHCDHDAFEITKTTINANNSTDKETQKIPAAIVEQIIIFGSTTVSSFFIQYCSEHKILVSYVSSHGAYYGGLRGIFVGNVLLRQSQYKLHDSPKRLSLVKNMIIGKIINQKNMLEYAAKTADISSKNH